MLWLDQLLNPGLVGIGLLQLQPVDRGAVLQLAVSPSCGQVAPGPLHRQGLDRQPLRRAGTQETA